MGQVLSAGSVGAASQWRHVRAGWSAPLPVSPCASLCSLCCSAVAREAGAGQAARQRHRVACERRGVFLSDAAERGRGATSTTPSSKSVAVESRRPRPRGAALVLRAVLRHGRASKSVLSVSGFVFARVALRGPPPTRMVCYVRHVVYSAAPTTPSSPWLRVDAATAFEKPDPEPIENQRQRPSRSRAARQPRPTRSDRQQKPKQCHSNKHTTRNKQQPKKNSNKTPCSASAPSTRGGARPRPSPRSP